MKLRILFLLLLGIPAVLLTTGCDDTDRNTLNVHKETTAKPTAELAGPIERDGLYVLEMTDGTDTVFFECTPNEGGLITKFMLNSNNVLSELRAPNQYGSTFWPSPQQWAWPPSRSMPNLASRPYQVTVESDSHTIVLESMPEPAMGIRFIKRFSPDLEKMAVNIQYTIQNTSDNEVSVAPWEISRVLPGGVTFFPVGEQIYKNDLGIEESMGMIWFLQPLEGDFGSKKLYADGKGGWVAHATSEMVFVKTFKDLPPSVRAPEQGEIEVYANGSIYQEIEQHGAYTTIRAGGQIHWNLKWYLRPLPTDAQAAIGNQPLIDFAASFASP